jgi:hypothetical protein
MQVVALVALLVSADLHADDAAINVAPQSGKVCVAIPEGRDDGDCAGLDLPHLRATGALGLAVVRKEGWQYEVSLGRDETKRIGESSAEDLAARGAYSVVTIANSPAARFETKTGVRYEVPSDDRALLVTFTTDETHAAEARTEAERMVKSIVRPRADLTLYGKTRAEQDEWKRRYRRAYERTRIAIRLVTGLVVIGATLLTVRAIRRRSG